MAQDFNRGDIVCIKSGSARMTVLDVTAQGVEVIWSDWDTKEVYRDRIPRHALELAPDKPGRR